MLPNVSRSYQASKLLTLLSSFLTKMSYFFFYRIRT